VTTTTTIRVRVRGRYLEALEDIDLPDGSEATATLVVPDPASARNARHALRSWNLGLGARQITREDGYGDDA
jgi:hypothetical protein